MSKSDVKFYNMLLHLIKNNKIYEENVAVKNVWEKDGNTFLDIYFYRKRKSYIFDSVFVHDITDLSTEKYYKDIKTFAADFHAASAPAVAQPDSGDDVWNMVDKKIFEPIDVDLLIMSFMARSGYSYDQLKKRIILNYIKEQIPQTRNLSQQYLESYIDNIRPDENGFYEALSYIDFKNPARVEHLCSEVLKICLSDGRLHYMEKVYWAELLQACREVGINIDIV